MSSLFIILLTGDRGLKAWQALSLASNTPPIPMSYQWIAPTSSGQIKTCLQWNIKPVSFPAFVQTDKPKVVMIDSYFCP